MNVGRTGLVIALTLLLALSGPSIERLSFTNGSVPPAHHPPSRALGESISNHVSGLNTQSCSTNESFLNDFTITTSDGSGPDLNSTPPYSNITLMMDPMIYPMSAVNVTIQSIGPNSLVRYADVFYNATFNGDSISGVVHMNYWNSTTEYTGDFSQLWNPSVLGPTPPNFFGPESFYVEAVNKAGCALKSPTYMFRPVLGLPPPPSWPYSSFYIIICDVEKHELVSGADANITFVVDNATKWVPASSSIFGFYHLGNWDDMDFVPVNTEYNVSVSYLGQTQSIHYFLSYTSNKTLTFLFDLPPPVPQSSASPPLWFMGTVAGVVGILATAGVVVSLFLSGKYTYRTPPR